MFLGRGLRRRQHRESGTGCTVSQPSVAARFPLLWAGMLTWLCSLAAQRGFYTRVKSLSVVGTLTFAILLLPGPAFWCGYLIVSTFEGSRDLVANRGFERLWDPICHDGDAFSRGTHLANLHDRNA